MTQYQFSEVTKLQPKPGHYRLARQIIHTPGKHGRGARTYTRVVKLNLGTDASHSNAIARLGGEPRVVEITPSGHWWVIPDLLAGQWPGEVRKP
jgi:hypothetical protein